MIEDLIVGAIAVACDIAALVLIIKSFIKCTDSSYRKEHSFEIGFRFAIALCLIGLSVLIFYYLKETYNPFDYYYF